MKQKYETRITIYMYIQCATIRSRVLFLPLLTPWKNNYFFRTGFWNTTKIR